MDDAADVRASLVDGGVQGESCFVDAQSSRPSVHHLSPHVHLHKCAGCHLRVQHAKWIHQELLMLLAYTHLEQREHSDIRGGFFSLILKD